jgi:ABC-type dipeptide/oligopeptide/nickel transport system permease component
MINKFKSLIGFFLILLIIILIVSQIHIHYFNNKIFNMKNIYSNTERLQSLKTKDQQTEYISNYFKNINLSPAGDNSTFYQNFKTLVPVNKGKTENNSGAFELKNTPNVLGEIKGSDKSSGYLIISSSIHGDFSGTAMLMEMARVLKLQNFKPAKTIVFAVWNSFDEGAKGSNYYADNPLFPLNKSEVLVLDNIGTKGDVLYLSTYGSAGEAIMGKLSSYSNDYRNVILQKNVHGNDNEAFILKDIPAVLLYRGSAVNSADALNQNSISSTGNIILSYLQRDIYGDWFHGLFSLGEINFIIILIISALFVYLIKLLYKAAPLSKLVHNKLENIYYSTIFTMADKIIQLLIIVIFAAFLLSFIVYIPSNFSVAAYNGSYISNYSIYIIAQNAVNYMRNFVSNGFGKTLGGFSTSYIISFSIIKSIILILSSIIIAFILGIITGALSGFTHKSKNNFRFIGSIVVLSLPDVLIGILLQLLMFFLYKHNLLLIGGDEKSQFVFPLICLTIIPTAYISRIAQIAVREEINKDYIIAARAKGLSNFKILRDHILISVVIKVVETLPSVLNIIISNVIIVEYMFSYPGIVYQLFSYFKDKDMKTCIGLIIGIGIIYFVLALIFKIAAIMINPYRRLNLIGGKQNEKA